MRLQGLSDGAGEGKGGQGWRWMTGVERGGEGKALGVECRTLCIVHEHGPGKGGVVG